MNLYNSLQQYTSENYLALHMPGHKRNPDFPLPNPAQCDITELPGFDSLYEETGPLAMLTTRVQNLYHSGKSFLCVNGSTGGILTAIRSATRCGDTILMARNCHTSVYHAATLFGLHCEYLVPEYLVPENKAADNTPPFAAADAACCSYSTTVHHTAGDAACCSYSTTVHHTTADAACCSYSTGIPLGITLAQVKAALARVDAALVVITSPTYEGFLSEVREIAEYLHSLSIPLLVDEAHGAALGFHPAFPGGAVAAGADLVVQSLHKTLPTLTQCAVLHVNGSLIPCDRAYENWRMLQTTSPSFLLLSSVDTCVTLLEQRASALFDALIHRLERFYRQTEKLKNLKVLTAPAEQKDASRLVILLPDGRSGQVLATALRERFQIEAEYSAPGYLIAISGIADREDALDRLAAALLALDDSFAAPACSQMIGVAAPPACTASTGAPLSSADGTDTSPVQNSTAAGQPLQPLPGITRLPESVLNACDIEFLPTRLLPYDSCPGQVSCEYLYLYPPGVPLLVPGERFSSELLSGIRFLTAAGFRLSGPRNAASRELLVWDQP